MSSNDFISMKLEKSGLFGYKVEDVEKYISCVNDYCLNCENEKKELESKIKILAEKIREYRDEEENIRDALLGAQKLGSNIINEAKDKAEKLLNEAKDRVSSKVRYAQIDAEKLLKETKYNIEKEKKSLLKIQKEVSTFKAKLLSLYKSHLDLITSLPEIEEDENVETSNPENIENEYSSLDDTKVIDTFDSIETF